MTGMPTLVAGNFDQPVRAPRGAERSSALMRGELTDLDLALRSASARAANRETRLHILDARAEIKQILDPGK